jgi:ABC-type antimicrobial peptide transport system permease subunit
LRYLDEHNYESNEEQLRNSRLSNVLKIISSILAAVAALIIFLSFLGFFQYAQLVLYRNQYEIRTLLDLGMPPKRLFGVYLKMISVVILGIGIGSLAALFFIQDMMQGQLEGYGLELAGQLRMEVLFSALIIFVLFFVIQGMGLRKGIHGMMPKR